MTGCGLFVDVLAVFGFLFVLWIVSMCVYWSVRFVLVVRKVVKQVYPDGFEFGSAYCHDTPSRLKLIEDGIESKFSYAYRLAEDISGLMRRISCLEASLPKPKAKKP